MFCAIKVYCIVLYCIALHCTALHCIVLYCIVFHFCITCSCLPKVYCIVLYSTSPLLAVAWRRRPKLRRRSAESHLLTPRHLKRTISKKMRMITRTYAATTKISIAPARPWMMRELRPSDTRIFVPSSSLPVMSALNGSGSREITSTSIS